MSSSSGSSDASTSNDGASDSLYDSSYDSSYGSCSDSDSDSSGEGLANFHLAKEQQSLGKWVIVAVHHRPTNLFVFCLCPRHAVMPTPQLSQKQRKHLAGWGPEMLRRGGFRSWD